MAVAAAARHTGQNSAKIAASLAARVPAGMEAVRESDAAAAPALHRIVRITTLLNAKPSDTLKLTVRVAMLGLALVFWWVTKRRASWYAATLSLPRRINV